MELKEDKWETVDNEAILQRLKLPNLGWLIALTIQEVKLKGAINTGLPPTIGGFVLPKKMQQNQGGMILPENQNTMKLENSCTDFCFVPDSENLWEINGMLLWEKVNQDTRRIFVWGGWVVSRTLIKIKGRTEIYTPKVKPGTPNTIQAAQSRSIITGVNAAAGVIFISDPDATWTTTLEEHKEQIEADRDLAAQHEKELGKEV